MHPGEKVARPSQVRRLVAGQMPDLAHLPLRRLGGGGTDNVLYRLGSGLLVRLPRQAGAAGEIDRLEKWLPGLAPHLALEVPQVLRRGVPGEGHPFGWSVTRWIAGRDAFAAPPRDQVAAALALADFLKALQAAPTSQGAPLRGGADRVRDILALTGPSIDQMTEEADPALLRAMVERALAVPDHKGALTWVQGDLHPLNLLVRRGRLAAVIDWGAMGLGDPGMDLMVAWTLFDAPARAVFRATLNPAPDAWERGRALALAKALRGIPYYRRTNPVFCAVMRATLARLVADHDQPAPSNVRAKAVP